MTATTSAARPAAQQAAVTADLVNVPTGYPAPETSPGAVDPAQYEWPGPGDPARTGPVSGDVPAAPFGGSLPVASEGGGYGDMAAATGHDAPQAAWDSSAGEPFAPSGALNPALHGEDTGGVYVREHVVPAAIGNLTRRTMAGQTYNQLAATQTAIGQTEPNGRTDLDQQQWHDPDAVEGFGPYTIPFAERPIYNNLAYEVPALSEVPTVYGVSGGVADMSAHGYGAVAYQAPPDPLVGAAAAASTSGIGGGWV